MSINHSLKKSSVAFRRFAFGEFISPVIPNACLCSGDEFERTLERGLEMKHTKHLREVGPTRNLSGKFKYYVL